MSDGEQIQILGLHRDNVTFFRPRSPPRTSFERPLLPCPGRDGLGGSRPAKPPKGSLDAVEVIAPPSPRSGHERATKHRQSRLARPEVGAAKRSRPPAYKAATTSRSWGARRAKPRPGRASPPDKHAPIDLTRPLGRFRLRRPSTGRLRPARSAEDGPDSVGGGRVRLRGAPGGAPLRGRTGAAGWEIAGLKNP